MIFSFYCPRAHRHLHSFPTRRSSDLSPVETSVANPSAGHCHRQEPARAGARAAGKRPKGGFRPLRSEEHTSELQSRGHLVCRLLLEKKKNGLARTPPHAPHAPPVTRP